jgi:hypothetical protein
MCTLNDGAAGGNVLLDQSSSTQCTLQCPACMYRLHVQAYRQAPWPSSPPFESRLEYSTCSQLPSSCATLPVLLCTLFYAPPLQPSCPCRLLAPRRACPAAACTLLAPCPCLAVMHGSCAPFPPFQAGPSTNPCQPPLTQLERRHTPDWQPHHTYLSATRMVVMHPPYRGQRTTSLYPIS